MEIEKKKRVRRPIMQVLLSRAKSIESRLGKMLGTEHPVAVSKSLAAEIQLLIDSGFVPPVNKRKSIAYVYGKPVRVIDKYAKEFLLLYSEVELNTMSMYSLDPKTRIVECKTADRHIPVRLRHLEERT